jgi:hypothetical protein
LSTSSADPAGTASMTSSVAGLITGIVDDDVAGIHVPPM